MEILVDQEVCTRCGACVALCTGRVFGHVNERVEVVTPDGCWLCGHCVAACPVDAVEHSEYPMTECPSIDLAAMPSLDRLVVDAFRERRSGRAFRDRPVERSVVRELVDLARWVPSAGNGQPVDWLAFDDPDRIAELSGQAVAALAETAQNAGGFERLVQRHAQGEDPIFFRAPVVLIAHVLAGNNFGRDDAIYATYNLMLGAQRMGLGTCQIGYFIGALERSHSLRSALELPEDRQIEVVLALGYPKYRFPRALPRRRPELVWDK